MRQFILTARAKRQLRAAITWWYRNRDKAPFALVEELDETAELLLGSPGVGKPVRARRPGVRRVLMERVRYYVYYRVNAQDNIEVLSVWHASRRPPRL
jgi:plasmid stabilization system protein ParE